MTDPPRARRDSNELLPSLTCGFSRKDLILQWGTLVRNSIEIRSTHHVCSLPHPILSGDVLAPLRASFTGVGGATVLVMHALLARFKRPAKCPS